jgi:hypothetical protein
VAAFDGDQRRAVVGSGSDGLLQLCGQEVVIRRGSIKALVVGG